VRPLGLDPGAFDNHMVDLTVIVSSLSFVFEVGIGASCDGVDCVMVERLLLCYRGSWIWSRGGGGKLGSILDWYIECIRYVICGKGEWYVSWGIGKGCV
jgi:hypothetical protein